MNDEIIFYIVLRQSLHLDTDQIACCTADAVQHLLLKYFAMLLLASKSKSDALAHDILVVNTAFWLKTHSPKTIKIVDDEVFEQIKKDFAIGKQLFSIKDKAIETTLFFIPNKLSLIPEYLRQ